MVVFGGCQGCFWWLLRVLLVVFGGYQGCFWWLNIGFLF